MAWQIQVKVRTRQEVRSGSSFKLFTNFFRGSSGSLRGFSGNSHEAMGRSTPPRRLRCGTWAPSQ